MVKDKYYQEWVEKMPDLSGKVIAITGTTSGTGFWAAVFAIRKNAKALLLLNRESQRSKDSLERLEAEKNGAGSETELISIACDLQNFEKVKEAAANVNEAVKNFGGLDVLFNNAGIGNFPDQRTGDGFDVQMQTNHLSHFLLTKLVFPSFDLALENGKEVRICQHSSSARHITGQQHQEKYFTKMAPGKLGGNGVVAGMRRYHQTKLANVTFAISLHNELQKRGYDVSKIKSVAAEPGSAQTEFASAGKNKAGFLRRQVLKGMFALAEMILSSQSAADGALPAIQACFGEDVDGGDFFIPEKRFVGRPIKTISQCKLAKLGRMNEEKLCLDEDNQRNCWEWSQNVCGQFFENKDAEANS